MCRPICTTEGCGKPAVRVRNDKQGNPVYRKYKDMPGEGWCCSKCHSTRIAKKHGLSSAFELTAKRKGMTASQYRHQQLKAIAEKAGLTVASYRQKLLEGQAAKFGLTVKQYRRLKLEERAAELGMTVYEYRISRSKYLWYREEVNYCENIDGRLGFVCNTNVVKIPKIWNGMLDVDHIDGNHKNNKRENLQTLCKCCHAYKSWKEEDWKTPGRKTRGKEAA